MPSSMIHTLAAYKYNPKASIAFKIGNLAPDSINSREKKDLLHLRTERDRLQALKVMMAEVDHTDDFQKGIVFHLYLDLLWDRGPLKTYIESYSGRDWFLDYRTAIGIASAWLYHQYEWSERVWNAMSKHKYTNTYVGEDYSVSAISDFIRRNHKWHRATKVDSIGHFSEELIDEITSYAADTFDQALRSVLIKNH